MITFHIFFSTSCKTCIVEKLLGLLLSMYIKMKGKYFASSMLENNSRLIVLTRQTQMVLADKIYR